MTIPLADLVAQYRTIQTDVDAAIRSVLESGHFILGPNTRALEREIAAYLGVRHAVGVASGTDALILTLHALGIGPGEEVIVPRGRRGVVAQRPVVAPASSGSSTW